MINPIYVSEQPPLVLVVDDTLTMQKYMETLLLEMGLRVICASDGSEAIEQFEKHKPNVVLMDAHMPVMDGITACSIIRSMSGGKDALIYMITGIAEEENAQQAFAVGFDDYFTKPIVKTAFTRRLKKALKNKHNLQRQKELNEARSLQKSFLPEPIQTEKLNVNHMYEPYDHVSGDFVDYFYLPEEQTLYGYVLDVTGHSISSALQVFAMRTLLRQGLRQYQDLSEVLRYANAEMFQNHQRQSMVAAIVFALNREDKILRFASAGISPFYISADSSRVPITTAGYPLGYKRDADYRQNTISVQNAQEIIFASDGFLDTFDNDQAVSKNRDDVSAIMIQILN